MNFVSLCSGTKHRWYQVSWGSHKVLHSVLTLPLDYAAVCHCFGRLIVQTADGNREHLLASRESKTLLIGLR